MEITNREVTKFSIKDEKLEATFNADLKGVDPNGNSVETTDPITRKSSQVIHADLKTALASLKPHLVIICEQEEANLVTDIYDFDTDKLENYEVTGYSISGSEESAGVCLIGKKLLKSGQVLNLVAPLTKYEDEDGYIHGGALMNDVEGCNFEVLAHLDGKWGLVQQEFDFDTPGESEETGGVQMKVVKDTEKELEEAS